MELKPFNPKLIKKLYLDHPYKILLKILYNYYPNYNSDEENDGSEDVTDLYFKLLDDYSRYGIAFVRKYELFPDNKLGVLENFGKTGYYLVDNHYDKKNYYLIK